MMSWGGGNNNGGNNSGFGFYWGTHREEQWRRRQEREYSERKRLKSKLQEQQQKVNHIRQDYEDKLKAKDNVLQLTKNLLSVSRNREISSVAGANNGTTTTTTTAATTTAATTTNSNHKKKRARIEEEEEDGKIHYDPSSQHPTTTTKNSNNKDQVDVDGDNNNDEKMMMIQENLLCLSYAMYDTLFATQNFNPKSFCNFLIRSGSRSVAEEVALASIEKTYGQADTVQYVLEELLPHSSDPENLLSLVKKTLVEEKKEDSSSATKTNGDGTAAGRILDEGKQVLLNWQLSQQPQQKQQPQQVEDNGNGSSSSEEPFQSALQINDEILRVKTCLPLLEGNPIRRIQLQQSSLKICSSTWLVNVFKAEEWPTFVESMNLPNSLMELGIYGPTQQWDPGWKVILHYAANSMNNNNKNNNDNNKDSADSEAGRRVGIKVLQELMRNISNGLLTGQTDYGLPGPTQISKNQFEAVRLIVQYRKQHSKNMKTFLANVEKEILGVNGSESNNNGGDDDHDTIVQKDLDTLQIDWLEILATFLEEEVFSTYYYSDNNGITMMKINNELCTTKNHRDILLAYKCRRCRQSMARAAKYIGALVGLREHTAPPPPPTTTNRKKKKEEAAKAADDTNRKPPHMAKANGSLEGENKHTTTTTTTAAATTNAKNDNISHHNHDYYDYFHAIGIPKGPYDNNPRDALLSTNVYKGGVDAILSKLSKGCLASLMMVRARATVTTTGTTAAAKPPPPKARKPSSSSSSSSSQEEDGTAAT